MTFWIDADSCPRAVRAIVARRAEKLGVRCIFVACRPVPAEHRAEVRTVPCGDQAADRVILEGLGPEDLVVTRDLHLAAEVLDRGASALSDRGVEWRPDSLRERLSVARAAREIYTLGLERRPGKTYDSSDVRKFAEGFDRWVQQRLKDSTGSA